MRVIKGTFAVSTEYTMKAIIEDGTGSISARLSHEVSFWQVVFSNTVRS